MATRKTEKDEEVIVGVLLSLLGREGLKIYETFTFTDPLDAKKIAEVLDTFTDYFEPLKSEVFDRFCFHKRVQKPGESFDAWLVDLRSMVKTCNYGTEAVVKSVIRDQIVLGVANDNVREKLLFESSLSLESACAIVRACEASSMQLGQISTRTEAQVHGLRDKAAKEHVPTQSSKSRGEDVNNCVNCGRRHRRNQCPAAGVTCFACGKPGHYSRRCPASNGQQRRGWANDRQMAPPTGQQPTQPQHRPAQRGTFMQHQLHSLEGAGAVGQEEPRFMDEEYVLHELKCSSGGEEWHEELSVDGSVPIRFKLDSGATCNVLPLESYKRIHKSNTVLTPGPRIRNYGARGGYLNVLGVLTSAVVRRGVAYTVNFVVVDEPGQPPILGLPTCQRMQLIQRVHSITQDPLKDVPPIVSEFRDIFTGIGKLPVEHDIRLATGANYVDPVVCAASRLPFRLEEKVFKKLDQMVKDEIIVPVVEPTEWVSRMLVVGKPDGDVRICLDPSELNKAILRQHFAVPTIEQLFGKIGKAKYFCSLDAASGFYQIPLSDRASYLCTMATPRGRYRYLRLPFGIKSAPEVYLQVMSDLFGDLAGVIVYFDDFLVTGETIEELEANLRQVFVRCRENNLKLQLKKCRFFLNQLPWLGHIIGQGTLSPDPEKVEAIVNMPDPTDKTGLTRLLGMVTYLDKFCKNLAALTRPLRDMLKKDVAWFWDSQQRKALSELKNAMSSLPILRLFDVNRPVVVSVDASPIGIGAVLMQEGQPVAFSSTTLTATQKRYCQIEKELLAVQFGLTRFRQYVYGQRVTVESDHKPLVGLLDKPIASCSPRIQRMRLQLQRFDFQLVYKPGKELFIADTLSRAPSPRVYSDDVTTECEEQVHHVINSVAPMESTRQRYARATAEDPTLQLLQSVMLAGWPEHRSQCPAAIKPFWPVRHDLAVVGGVVLLGSRLVVPVALRREAMDGVHDGHFGETKSVLRAKSSVYWPGWEDHVRNVVASCPVCQENRPKNPKLPLFPVRIPEYAFQLVSADLFEFNNVNYILVVDSYSKWPCVVPLRSVTSSAVINEMTRFFCDFGRPETLESDNGTQFASAEFREFCRTLGIAQVTSSPEFAQSNGLVERHIQTVKKTILKMFADGKSLWEALSAIRSTPISSVLPSPSVLLQGRNFRGTLPFLPSELTPRLVPASAVASELCRRQAKAVFDTPRRTDARSSVLHVGQRVRTLVGKKWRPGAVQSVCKEPHSYFIRLSDGRLFRRTRWAVNVDKGVANAVDTGLWASVGTNDTTPVPSSGQQPIAPSSVTMRRPFQQRHSRTAEIPPACPSPARAAVPRVDTPAPPTPVSSHVSQQGAQQYSGGRRSSSWQDEGPSRAVPVRLFPSGRPATTEEQPSSSDPVPTSSSSSEPFGTTRSGVKFGIGHA